MAITPKPGGGSWVNYQPVNEKVGNKLLKTGKKDKDGKLITIKYKDVPFLFNDKFWRAYDIWETWKLLKVLPNGRGWLQENSYIIKIIKEFEKEFQAVQIEVNTFDKVKNKRGGD